MEPSVWGLLLALIVQTVTIAFFIGRMFEKSNSHSRRLTKLEDTPVINHEAKLAAIDVSLQGVKENMKSFEDRIEERFKSLEGTFRNMVQLATSATRSHRDVS